LFHFVPFYFNLFHFVSFCFKFVSIQVLKRFTKRGLATSLPSMLLFRDRKVYPYLGDRDSVDQMAAFGLEGGWSRVQVLVCESCSWHSVCPLNL
jgi:hypothetical protein